MKAAIEECVAREERYVGEKLEDIKRWERYQASGHSISQESVETWLSSWGTKNELPCPE